MTVVEVKTDETETEDVFEWFNDGWTNDQELVIRDLNENEPNQFKLDLNQFSLDEKKSLIPNEKTFSILGVLEGQLTFPGDASRNGRWYEDDHWIVAERHPDVQHKMKNGLMFGQLGHRDGAVTEVDLANGDVCIRLAEFDARTGRGKIYILETDSGKNLMAAYNSGSRPFVSTRGTGTYLKNRKKLLEGKYLSIVDKRKYLWECIDVVFNPGSLKAHPKLVKGKNNEDKNVTENNLNESDSEIGLKETEEMADNDGKATNAALQVLTEDKKRLSTNLNESSTKIGELTAQNESLNSQVEKLNEDKEKTDFLLTSDPKILETLKDLYEKNQLSSVKDLPAFLSFKKSPKELDVMIEDSRKVIESYKECGEDPAKIKEQLEELKEIDETLTVKGSDKTNVEKIKILGNMVESVKNRLLEPYSFKTIDEVAEAVDLGQEMKEELEESEKSRLKQELKENAEKYHKQYGITIETAYKVLSAHNLDEAVELFEEMKGKGKGKPESFGNKPSKNISEGKKGDDSEDQNESDDKPKKRSIQEIKEGLRNYKESPYIHEGFMDN